MSARCEEDAGQEGTDRLACAARLTLTAVIATDAVFCLATQTHKGSAGRVLTVCRPVTKLVPDCIARRSVASLGLEPAAAVGGTSMGMGEGLRLTGGAGRVRCLALSSAPCLQCYTLASTGHQS